MPPTPDAAALAEALGALAVTVETVRCAARDAAAAAYPGGARPTSTVTLAGGDAEGRGEHVAWTAADHARFCAAAPALAPHGRWRLGAWSAEVARRTAAPYARAALEAAVIDLALRQAGTNLFALAGVAPRPVRYVVSFARRPDAAAAGGRLAAAAPGVGLKLDVDPAWDDGVYAALAALGTVRVLDFKLTGTRGDHERAHRALPEALLEDPSPDGAPWSPGLRRRLSVDAALRAAADLAALPVRPAAANLKPARMGGVLETLRAAAACAAAGVAPYLGGMFEVDVGRRQLWALAALLAPEGPNDVAPIAAGGAPPPWPPRLVLDPDALGFGATLV